MSQEVVINKYFFDFLNKYKVIIIKLFEIVKNLRKTYQIHISIQ